MKNTKKEKKIAILDATLELIAANGFHGTSVAQIAKAANVNVGSIYYYFASKEDLLNTIYIEKKISLARFAVHNYSSSMPLEDGVKQFLKNIVIYLTENPLELSFMEQFENSPLINSINSHKNYRNIVSYFEEIFGRTKSEGVIKTLPIEIIELLCTSAILALAKYTIHSRDKYDESLLESSINAIWDMIKK